MINIHSFSSEEGTKNKSSGKPIYLLDYKDFSPNEQQVQCSIYTFINCTRSRHHKLHYTVRSVVTGNIQMHRTVPNTSDSTEIVLIARTQNASSTPRKSPSSTNSEK
uniref:Uncharacterized protein n=1 Tax=Cacopsylla melanoneura TaxID=428564 RepID=A0A8D8Z844_9HEMI